MKGGILILVLAFMVGSACCLSVGEIETLQKIYESSFGLRAVDPPWNSNASSACDPPGFYGVSCSPGPDPHILSLSFADSHMRIALNMSLKPLSYLQQLSVVRGCVLGPFSAADIGSDSLEELTLLPTLLGCPAFDIHFGSLLNLKSLVTLQIRASFTGSFPEGLSHLTSLKVLQFQHNATNGAPLGLYGTLPPFDRHSSLESFWLENIAVKASDTVFSRTLRNFRLISDFNFHGNLQKMIGHCIELRTLECGRTIFQGSLDFLGGLTNLTSLSLKLAQLPRIQALPSSVWSLPKLKTIELVSIPLFFELTEAIANLKGLEELTLSDVKMYGTIPEGLGTLENLTTLIISGSAEVHGSIPSSLGNLRKLRVLTISHTEVHGVLPELRNATSLTSISFNSNQLVDTIPPSITQLPKLQVLILYDNGLEGTLPEFSSAISHVYLSHNSITGTIPASLASRATTIDLAWNAIKSVPTDTFINNPRTMTIDLTNNQLEGEPFDATPFATITVSNNRLNGTIPASWCAAAKLDFSGNQLAGNVDALLLNCTVTEIIARNNFFSGTINMSPSLTALQTFDISLNSFHGPLPFLPPSLSTFDASWNTFDGPISDKFLKSVLESTTINKLDLSHNTLECPENNFVSELFYTPIRHLNLGYNQLTCQLQPREQQIVNRPSISLIALDLSHNSLQGPFHLTTYRYLMSLKLQNNRFSGVLGVNSGLTNFPSLTSLDISFNQFEFAADEIKTAQYLLTFNGSNNNLYGGFYPTALPNLQTVDLSLNNIESFGFSDIGFLITTQALKVVTLTDNAVDPFLEMPASIPPLQRSTRSAPLTSIPRGSSLPPLNATNLGVKCYTVEFVRSPPDVTLTYDIDLFSFAQCDCDEDHFGVPPYHCFTCPSTADACNTNSTHVPHNEFALPLYNDSLLAIESESCIVNTAQAVTGVTNCNGLKINGHLLFKLITNSSQTLPKKKRVSTNNRSSAPISPPVDTYSIDELFATQCLNGSEGRLCSLCSCNSEKCYFMKGTICHECRSVLSLIPSILLFIGLIVIALVTLTILMFFILKSYRRKVTKPYENLSLFKRIFYRLMVTKSLGNVTILITFLQLLSQLTHWETYILRQALELLNGAETRSLGLVCAFPFLDPPLASLLFRITLPLLVILLVGASVFFAAILSRKTRPKISSKFGDSNGSISGEWEDLLVDKDPGAEMPYPAMALFTSVALTAIRFFYFETALTAHEYLFPVYQRWTGLKYVRNHPWMKYSDALPLIGVSIPPILIFDLLLPIAFLVLCWKVRHSYKRPEVSIYFGTLFDTFSERCFWWEIVNILRKLAIALVLQGLSPSDAFQPGLIVSIIIGAQFVQVSLSPWKRRTENIADNISAALLVCSMLATRSTSLHNSSAIMYIAGALDIGFIVVSIAMIGFQTWVGKTSYQARFEAWAQHGSLTDVSITNIMENSINAGSSASDGENGLLEESSSVLLD